MMNEEMLELIIKGTVAKSIHSVGVGIAKNINTEERTCDIELTGGATLFQCRLNAIIDNYDSQVLTVPKENSMVLYAHISNHPANVAVISYSEVEKVLVKVGDSEVEINDKKIVLNGGKNGLVKIEELISRLNEIEDAINNHTHPYMNVTASATTSPATPGTGIILKAKKADMEDTKILHS